MSDLSRRLFVTASEVFCVVGTLFGVGVLGTRVEESSGGALAADATLLAPYVSAFSIWSVIYIGLFGYTVVQWLPRYAQSARFRSTGTLAAISMILNATWLLVTQQGWIALSVVVIFALAITLGMLLQRLSTLGAAQGWLERSVVDATFGLYTGWVAVATCANVTAALVAQGVNPSRSVSEAIAVVVLIVAVGVVGLVLKRTGRRLSLVLAAAWGLGWIAVGRLADQPHSQITGIAAALAALVVVALWAKSTEVTS
ncbi:MAG: hypothetical protein V9E81_05540 [Marmoricola sp.]